MCVPRTPVWRELYNPTYGVTHFAWADGQFAHCMRSASPDVPFTSSVNSVTPGTGVYKVAGEWAEGRGQCGIWEADGVAHTDKK